MSTTTRVILFAALITLSGFAAYMATQTDDADCDLKHFETDPPITIDLSRRGPVAARQAPIPLKTLTPDNFCMFYTAQVCRKLFACLEPEVLARDASAHGFVDEATCRHKIDNFCGKFMLQGLEASVEAGRVRWDGEAYARCFKQWRTMGCTEPLGDLPAIQDCRAASLGTVPPGGTCHTAFDCGEIEGEELLCAFPEEGPGQCLALGKLDEPCQFSDRCQQALRCREGRCQPPGRKGEHCRFEDDCEGDLNCGAESGLCEAAGANLHQE